MPFLLGDHSCSGNTLARNTKVTKKKTKLFTVLSLSVLTCQQPDVFERMNGVTQLILYSHCTGKPLHGHEKPYRRGLLFRTVISVTKRSSAMPRWFRLKWRVKFRMAYVPNNPGTYMRGGGGEMDATALGFHRGC